MSKPTVLVTGGTGFIGGCLYRHIIRSGYPVYRTCHSEKYEVRPDCIAVNLASEAHVIQLMAAVKPDVVFHCAARATVNSDQEELWASNVIATEHVIKFMKPDSTLCFTSSATVYGNCAKSDKPSKEEDNLSPTLMYGRYKQLCETCVSHAKHLKKYIVGRLTANVGKEATHGSVIDITRKWMKHNEVTVFGQCPGSIKPYTHVQDTVYALAHLTFGDAQSGIYNVSTSDNLSIEGITTALTYLLGLRKLTWNGQISAGDNQYVLVDNSKMLEAGCKFFFTRSEDAVFSAIQEIVQNEGGRL